MSRDFHSLDRLRLDKYLYLIRCYVGVAFEVFLAKGLSGVRAGVKKEQGKGERKGNKEGSGKRKGSLGKRKRGEEADENGVGTAESGDLGIWKELGIYLDMLEEGPLCPINFDPENDNGNENPSVRMHKGPDGLRYHLLDIWLDEIEKVAAVEVEADGDGNETGEDGSEGNEAGSPTVAGKTQEKKGQLKTGVPMELLLRPIVRLQEKSISKLVRKRAGVVLDDERLVEWGVRERKKTDYEEENEEEEGWGGIEG